MLRKEVRAKIRWPDGLEQTTQWVPDGCEGSALDGLFVALRDVLDQRMNVGGAIITWERRDVQTFNATRQPPRSDTDGNGR
jgi:hypothetical protein